MSGPGFPQGHHPSESLVNVFRLSKASSFRPSRSRITIVFSLKSPMSLIKTLASHYRQNILAARHGTHLPQAFGAHPAAFTGLTNNFSIGAGTATYHTAPKTDASLAQEQPSARSPFSSWFRWALGSLLTMVLPMWDNKWKTLLRLEGEVEMAAEMVETAADAVEKIATVAEKMASDVAKNLPEDGKLKGAALFVEHASKEVAEEAHLAKDIVHKVDEVKHEVEMFIEPIVHHKEKTVDRVEGGHGK